MIIEIHKVIKKDNYGTLDTVDITPALREVLELLEPSKFDKRYDTRTNQARNKLAKILEVEE